MQSSLVSVEVKPIRVVSKLLGIDKSFGIKKHNEAAIFKESVEKKLKTLKLIAELSINKIFNVSHDKADEVVRVKGLKRIARLRKGTIVDSLIFSYTKDGRQKRISLNIFNGRTFEEAWKEMSNRICSELDVERSLEIIALFKKAKRRYWERPKITNGDSRKKIGSGYGGSLKARRLELRLSMKEVAEAVGVSIPSYSYWERNIFVPSDDKKVLLSNLLGINDQSQ